MDHLQGELQGTSHWSRFSMKKASLLHWLVGELRDLHLWLKLTFSVLVSKDCLMPSMFLSKVILTWSLD